jgi:hypothetical protein
MSLIIHLLRSAGARSLHRLAALRPGASAAEVLARLGPPDSVLPGDEPGCRQQRHTLYDQQRGWVPCLLVLAGTSGPLLHWRVDDQRQRAFDDLLAGLQDTDPVAPPTADTPRIGSIA